MIDELKRVIIFFLMLMFTLLCAQEREPSNDHLQPVASPLHGSIRSHTDNQLKETLRIKRQEETKIWSNYLLESHYWWYRLANVSETLCKCFQVATPILVAINVHYQDTTLQVIGATSATVVLALSGFTNFSKKESSERLTNANRIFKDEGITEMTIIRDGSSNTIA